MAQKEIGEEQQRNRYYIHECTNLILWHKMVEHDSDTGHSSWHKLVRIDKEYEAYTDEYTS